MGQWTDAGFVAHQKSEYKASIQNIFREAFGSDFALDDTLPQGVLIDRLAELFYAIDMDGVEAFARLNLNTLGGVMLDVVGNFRGITRVLGEPQTGVAQITCNSTNFTPFSIPAGTIFTTQSGDTFETVNLVTVTAFTATNIDIRYTANGNSSAIVGDTMTVSGFPRITNIEIISLFNGTENETDLAYRRRIQLSYPAAMGTNEYIISKLYSLPTVESVDVLYNDTDSTDGNNVPAYSTEFLVAPKDNVVSAAMQVFKDSVARVILNNKTPGAPTFGNTAVSVQDIFGTTKTVNFTIPTKVNVEIDVLVASPETTGRLDLSNEDAIKEAIVAYINGLAVGKDVSYARCIAPLATDPGFDIMTFKMRDKTSETWVSNANLVIGIRQYASITKSDIHIGI